ncbi:efflux RND transporter permease subunit [Sulfurovum sp.]|uniref:efflux RND transporter permease subunit n=1 Tax=Sulfurovum sp. TaxID=1969726 RepID=UPI0035657F50
MKDIVYKIINSKRNKWIITLIVLISMGAAVMMIPTKLVLARMLPGKSANTMTIYVDTATNASSQETQSVTTCIVNYLKQEREITDMEVYLGQGAPLDYAGLVKGSALKRLKNQAEIVLNFTNKNDRDEATYMMAHRLRPHIEKECGDIVPHTSIKFTEMPAGPPTLATIVVELYNPDANALRKMAAQVANILEDTEGLVDVDVMQDDIYTKYNLVPDKEKIILSGLNVEQVNQIIYLAFKGMPIAEKNTKNQQDQIPIFLRLNEETRVVEADTESSLLSKLVSLELMNDKGMMVPISEVVKIKSAESSPTIFRKNLKNMVTITAECDMVSQVYPLLEAREKMLEVLKTDYNMSKVPGINTYMFDLIAVDKKTGDEILIRWDGEMKVSLDTFRDLGGAFIAALVLMFLLMVVYYKSFALSGIVLIGSFLSIIGVIVGHWVTDKISLYAADTHFFLTATSLIGFISLMGISARSSLLLIDFSKSLIADEGMEKKEAIAVATATRAKPIMLTAIAIILGSLLLATDPIFGGLGIALIFGSIAATLVSLFFIPVLMDNARALMPDEHQFDDGERKGTWCILTDNLKSLFPGKKEKKREHTAHEDTLLYEGYECEETDRTTWCTLIDNIKSFFPDKKEVKDDEENLVQTKDTLHYEEAKRKEEENNVKWRTTLIDNVKSFLTKKSETKADDKNKMTLSTMIDKVKSFLNVKTEDEVDNAYEKAKAERDFINLHNMGNKQFQKRDLDKAIESYEKALKIKEDKGTSFKLELAKVQKEKEDKKKQAEKDDKKDQDKTEEDKPKKDENKDTLDSKKEKKSKKKKDDKEE